MATLTALAQALERIRRPCIIYIHCRKNKSLLGVFGKLLKLGFDSKQQVDKRICKEAGLNDNVCTGIPTRQQVMETIRNYYNGD